MGKRKGGGAFDPPTTDDLSEIPTLAEIQRLDTVLWAIVSPLIGREPHPARVEADARSGTAGTRQAPAKSTKRRPTHGG